jgi:hypothetical protein
MTKDGWSPKVECCGNCAFWPLGNYQHDFKGAEPQGTGGHHTDGSVSDCRRYAPSHQRPDMYPSATARWPTTNKRDYCGEFEQR